MLIDLLWLKDNFQTFNTRYFENGLPEPRFFIGHSKSQLGSLACQRGLVWGRRFFGKGKSANAFTLSISNYYDQTEYQFRNVLLHEMIHLSIAVSGVKDTSPHGVVFRGIMARLNRDGWHIQVTTRIQGTRKAYTGSENVIKQYLVLAIETSDGKHFLSSVNPKFAKQIDNRLKQVREVTAFHWFTTDNRWFEDMPRVRSLRGRLTDSETFDWLTSTMIPL